VAAPVTILSRVFSMCAPGALRHETITVPAAEAALASSELPTAAKLAGTAIAVGGKRVDRRRSGRASARAVAMQATGFAIYGFGRIGRQVARVALKNPEVELTLTDAPYDAEYLASQIKYDSSHGRCCGTVGVDSDSLVVNGQKVSLTGDPAEVPVAEHGTCASPRRVLHDQGSAAAPQGGGQVGRLPRAGQGSLAHHRHGRELDNV